MSTVLESLLESLPTIPSTWTAPSSCFASTNYYYVLLGSGFFSNMYGTPTPVLDGNIPTGDCFPTDFTINVPYVTDGGCPQGYTRACATGTEIEGERVSAVTCCPSVDGGAFSFMCKDHEYGCHATATGQTWTGVITDIGLPDPTEVPVTRTPNNKEGIEGWGIKFLQVHSTATPEPTSTEETSTTHSKSTTITSTATTDVPATTGSQENAGETQSPAASGLSTAAVAGISVGSVLAVVVGLVGAFVLYRHRKKKSKLAAAAQEAETRTDAKPPQYIYSTEGPQLLDGREQRVQQTWELPGQ